MVEGGLSCPSDIAKALAAGADCVVIDTLLAGVDEAPGEIVYHQSSAYKVVNTSKTAASSDPYALDEEPVDTSTPYRGPVVPMINHLVNGLRIAMAYTGARDIKTLRETAEFLRTNKAW